MVDLTFHVHYFIESITDLQSCTGYSSLVERKIILTFTKSVLSSGGSKEQISPVSYSVFYGAWLAGVVFSGIRSTISDSFKAAPCRDSLLPHLTRQVACTIGMIFTLNSD